MIEKAGGGQEKGRGGAGLGEAGRKGRWVEEGGGMGVGNGCSNRSVGPDK